MRIVPLLTLMLVGASLPLHAAPPANRDNSVHAEASAQAPRSRIGDVMGSLTSALREAAAQQAQAQAGAKPAAGTAPASIPATTSASAMSLPTDATAQATVP